MWKQLEASKIRRRISFSILFIFSGGPRSTTTASLGGDVGFSFSAGYLHPVSTRDRREGGSMRTLKPGDFWLSGQAGGVAPSI